MKNVLTIVCLVTLIGSLGCVAGRERDDSASPGPAEQSQSSPNSLALGVQLYGVTIDDVSNLNGIVASLRTLPYRPTTRIVFDQGEPPDSYTDAVAAIRDASFIMGELLDSEGMSTISLADYEQRTNDYFNAFKTNVDIWEIGNEINGSWLGSPADVAAKMASAFNIVKQQGGRTELTLYGCTDEGDTYDMFNWVDAHVPPSMISGLDYVLVSYYEGDCGNRRSDWQSVFDRLHQIFPNAGIGFGETGAVNRNGDDITNTRIAGPYLNKYYDMRITTPNYVGGYFWWYFAEDMVPTSKPMLPILQAAMRAMP